MSVTIEPLQMTEGGGPARTYASGLGSRRSSRRGASSREINGLATTQSGMIT
jgi:hypothetical protein